MRATSTLTVHFAKKTFSASALVESMLFKPSLLCINEHLVRDSGMWLIQQARTLTIQREACRVCGQSRMCRDLNASPCVVNFPSHGEKTATHGRTRSRERRPRRSSEPKRCRRDKVFKLAVSICQERGASDPGAVDQKCSKTVCMASVGSDE